MGYEIHATDGVVAVTVEGVGSRHWVAAALLEVSRVAQVTAARGVLLDLRRARLQLTILDVYEMAKSMTKAFAPGTWCAAVIPRSDPMKLGRFWETVALNRGLRSRLFADREKAEAWLREPAWDRAAV